MFRKAKQLGHRKDSFRSASGIGAAYGGGGGKLGYLKLGLLLKLGFPLNPKLKKTMFFIKKHCVFVISGLTKSEGAGDPNSTKG